MARDSDQLVDCVSGVLFAGAGEPARVWEVFGLPIEDHAGSDYAVRVRGVRVFLLGGIAAVELRAGVCLHFGSSGVRVLGEELSGKPLTFI